MNRASRHYSENNKDGRVTVKPAFMLVQFVVCLVFWLVLSGHYDTKHVIMGVLASVIVTFLTNDLFYTFFFMRGMGDSHARGSIIYVFKVWLRIGIYAFWLLYQIILANFHVAYLVLHPKMPIDPKIISFESSFQKSISLVTLANSITLTPGTVTIDLHGGQFLIHALDKESIGSLVDGSMQNRIAIVFGEDKNGPPDIKWSEKVRGLR